MWVIVCRSRGTNVIINSTTSQCSNHSVSCFSYCYNTEDLEYGRCPNDQYIYIYCGKRDDIDLLLLLSICLKNLLFRKHRKSVKIANIRFTYILYT